MSEDEFLSQSVSSVMRFQQSLERRVSRFLHSINACSVTQHQSPFPLTSQQERHIKEINKKAFFPIAAN
jgi:RecG-like helicase